MDERQQETCAASAALSFSSGPPTRNGAKGEWIAALARSHGRQLIRYLNRLVGYELAQEAAQEAYLKLYRLTDINTVVCPRALLFATAVRLARQGWRKQQRCKAHEVLEIEAIEAHLAYDPQLDRQLEIALAVQSFLASTEIHAPGVLQLVLLHYGGFSRGEVAAELGISINAVEQRWTRARRYSIALLATLGIESADVYAQRRSSPSPHRYVRPAKIRAHPARRRSHGKEPNHALVAF